MNSAKIHSVTLSPEKAKQLNGKRLACVVARHWCCVPEPMQVSDSFDEIGKHVVSITLVVGDFRKSWGKFGDDTKPFSNPVFGGTGPITLNQSTVDKIEVATEETEFGRYAKMGR